MSSKVELTEEEREMMVSHVNEMMFDKGHFISLRDGIDGDLHFYFKSKTSTVAYEPIIPDRVMIGIYRRVFACFKARGALVDYTNEYLVHPEWGKADELLSRPGEEVDPVTSGKPVEKPWPPVGYKVVVRISGELMGWIWNDVTYYPLRWVTRPSKQGWGPLALMDTLENVRKMLKANNIKPGSYEVWRSEYLPSDDTVLSTPAYTDQIGVLTGKLHYEGELFADAVKLLEKVEVEL